MAVSNRTVNRVRDHGSHWRMEDCRVFKGTTIHKEIVGQLSVLFRCPPECGWVGWVNFEELKELGVEIRE